MAQEQLKIVKSEPLPPDWVEAAQGAREGAGQPETFFGMGIDPRLTQAISGAVESEKARTASGRTATTLGASFFPRTPLAYLVSALTGAEEAASEGENPLVGAGVQTGLQATGLPFGGTAKAAGRQFFKGGLKEGAVETFGDLKRMVSEGSIHPDKAMQTALGLMRQIEKASPGMFTQKTLRQGAGELTSGELSELGGRRAASYITKARQELINTLDAIIRVAPKSKGGQMAQKAKSHLGLSLAETGAISRAPSAGAAALGAIMGGAGGAGGYMVGGAPGAVLGATIGAGIPLFVGGHPTVQRALGKGLYRAGQGAEVAMPAGLRALIEMFNQMTDEKPREDQP